MDNSQFRYRLTDGLAPVGGASPPLRRSLTVGGSPSRFGPGRTPPTLAALYRDDKYSDLLITCQGKRFKVHKAVVCPQCPFFDRACSNGFLESQQGVIDLPEDDPAVLDCVIRYLYTGRYSDGDPETESPPPETVQRPRSSHDRSPGEDALGLALALSSPYHGPTIDQPSVHSHQNLLALQSVPAWDDHRFRFTHHSEPEQGGDSPWYTGSQFDYGGHIALAEDRQPLGKSRGASRSLYLHLQVYVTADKYGIVALQAYAASRFTGTVHTRWGQLERFPEIVDELYASTPRHDPLRDFTAELIAKHYRDVMFRSWIRAVLEKHNDLTLAVLDKMVELPWPRTPS